MESEHIFLIACLIMAVSMVAIMFKRGKEALAIFPTLDSVSIIFREKGASGNSRKSLKTKLGGAKNILDIIVTHDELWVRSPILFAGFGKPYDLLHKVKLENISNVALTNRSVVVSFKTGNNSETTLDLKLMKSQDFVQKLNKTKAFHLSNN